MALNVQTWLKENNGDFDLLNQQLGIDTVFHPIDNRCILNYNMLASPKENLIVRECRGLVLDKTDFSIVAKSFCRFFNLGEVKGETDKFVWENSIATHKEDGSLILLYHYNGEWRVNTRGSFADCMVNGLTFTWRDLFLSALHNHDVLNYLHQNVTYVFELCTPYTQIVRIYPEPTLYLLSMFNNELGYEYSHEAVEYNAATSCFKRPDSLEFKDQFDAMAYIAKKAEVDKTFEGLVLRDPNNRRLKIKSDFYIQLHRLSNNGNVAHPNRIAELILMGEQDEVLTYYTLLKPDFERVGARIAELVKSMDNVWFCFHDCKSQKAFAHEVKTHPLSKILFDARKMGTTPSHLLKQKDWQNIVVDVITKESKI